MTDDELVAEIAEEVRREENLSGEMVEIFVRLIVRTVRKMKRPMDEDWG